MELGKTLYVKDRKAWRAWLSKEHKKAAEIWLIYYRKGSAKPRIPYHDAVEEALCFGWIDSTIKGIDDERFAQRFSPRKPKSGLSQMNRERIQSLIKRRKMTKAGLAAVAHAGETVFKAAPAILKRIKARPQAWKNFQAFPEPYKRIRLAYIESRKRHGKEFYEKALEHFIDMTEKNKRFGFVKEMS